MAFNLITLLGPTASGKTRLAALLCSRFQGEIISCDSRQFYRGMDIGTGKDYTDYLVGKIKIPSHLLDFLNPSEDYDVFHYQHDFTKVFRDIIDRKKLSFLVGGSGLYLSSILQQYRFAAVDLAGPRYQELSTFPDEVLRELLFKTTPTLHNTTDLIDRDRLIRAIIVAEGEKNRADTESSIQVSPLVLGIFPGREVVKQHIAARLKARLEKEGMIDEVAALLSSGISPERLKFFGLEYRYITSFLLGELSRAEMEEQLRFAIFNFAKRQMTWFRRMEKQGVQINWLVEPWLESAISLINSSPVETAQV
jgi:tRNA dimethylallyltransferase